MSRTPTVSIVLPNYNYARYLDERIQSLLNQTYSDFELIILDDASTDHSIDIINAYAADPRIRTHFFSENSGSPFRRWNDGASLARGKYLWIAEADDTCEPTLLEKLVPKLEAHPAVGLVYCQSTSIDENGRYIGSWQAYTDTLDPARWREDFVERGRNELNYLLQRNTIPNASAVLMRRQLFFDAGMADPSFKVIGDWMLWWKILMQADVAFVAEPLNHFRTHAGSVRGKSLQQRLVQFIEEYRGLKSRLDSVPFPPERVETACEDIASRWLKTLLAQPGFARIKTGLQIYRVGSGVDPGLRGRVLRILGRQPRKWLRKKRRGDNV